MRSRREFLQMAAVSASYFTAIPNFAGPLHNNS